MAERATTGSTSATPVITFHSVGGGSTANTASTAGASESSDGGAVSVEQLMKEVLGLKGASYLCFNHEFLMMNCFRSSTCHCPTAQSCARLRA